MREGLERLASGAFDGGAVVPFESQLDAWAYGSMPSGDEFVVAESAREAGLPEASDLPILMRQRTLRKVQAEHDIPLEEVRNLPGWIAGHPLSMESITEENALVVVADARDVHGNDIVIALHMDREKQGLSINEITSVYGKRSLAYLIDNTVSLGKEVYVNERTGGWLLHTGLQLPEQTASRLQDKINALEAFSQEGPEIAPGRRDLGELTLDGWERSGLAWGEYAVEGATASEELVERLVDRGRGELAFASAAAVEFERRPAETGGEPVREAFVKPVAGGPWVYAGGGDPFAPNPFNSPEARLDTALARARKKPAPSTRRKAAPASTPAEDAERTRAAAKAGRGEMRRAAEGRTPPKEGK